MITNDNNFKNKDQSLNKKGFTLIELVVVVAIIGLLSVLSIMALNSASKRSRDALRLSHLQQLRHGLDLYFINKNSYPEGTNIILGSGNFSCLNENGWQSAGCPNPYLNPVPSDPKNGSYMYTSASSTYTVSATLEGQIENLSGVIRLNPAGISK